MKSEESIPSTSQSTPEVQEQISEASGANSDGTNKPPEGKDLPRQSLKVKLPLKLLKRGHQTTASSSRDGVTPSKVRKEPEANEVGVGTPSGPSEAALQKARFELPRGPGGPCPDPRTPGGRGDYPTGTGLFPRFSLKAGSR